VDDAALTPAIVQRHLLAILDERDRRYAERFEAQQLGVKDALAAQEKAVTAALTAADRAVAKAENASERRFEGVNEFRATLADQAANLMPRAEAEARMRSLSDKLDAQQKVIDTQQGARAGTHDSWGYLVGFAGLVLVLINIYLATKGTK